MAEVYGADTIHNTEGGLVMNIPIAFAHGLILGSLLTAWVAFMLRK
jgi:hypothetical protein